MYVVLWPVLVQLSMFCFFPYGNLSGNICSFIDNRDSADVSLAVATPPPQLLVLTQTKQISGHCGHRSRQCHARSATTRIFMRYGWQYCPSRMHATERKSVSLSRHFLELHSSSWHKFPRSQARPAGRCCLASRILSKLYKGRCTSTIMCV